MKTPDANPFCLPCVNCAGGLCCPPPEQLAETISMLCALGMDEDVAPKAAHAMLHEHGVVFFPASIANAIAEFVDHPGRVRT